MQITSKIQEQLRNKPMLWTAVAAGAGLIIGIAGRIVSRRQRGLPTMILLEAC